MLSVLGMAIPLWKAILLFLGWLVCFVLLVALLAACEPRE